METLPGYDDWKLRGPNESEATPVLYDELRAKLEAVTELTSDGDEEWRIGCDEPFQNLSLNFSLLARDNHEALYQLSERLEQTLGVVKQEIARRLNRKT